MFLNKTLSNYLNFAIPGKSSWLPSAMMAFWWSLGFFIGWNDWLESKYICIYLYFFNRRKIYGGCHVFIVELGKMCYYLFLSRKENGPVLPLRHSASFVLWYSDMFRDSLVAQMVKNQPAMLETSVQSLGKEDPLGVAIHSSILALRIPRMEEPIHGSQRVGHDWMTITFIFTFRYVCLPGNVKRYSGVSCCEVQLSLRGLR